MRETESLCGGDRVRRCECAREVLRVVRLAVQIGAQPHGLEVMPGQVRTRLEAQLARLHRRCAHGGRDGSTRLHPLNVVQDLGRVAQAREGGRAGRQLAVRVLPVENAIVLAQRVVVLIVLDLHVVHHVEAVLLVVGAPGHGDWWMEMDERARGCGTAQAGMLLTSGGGESL